MTTSFIIHRMGWQAKRGFWALLANGDKSAKCTGKARPVADTGTLYIEGGTAPEVEDALDASTF